MQDQKTRVSSSPPQDPAPPPEVQKNDEVTDSNQPVDKKPGKFVQFLGNLLGGALSMIAPGAGWLIGGLINRGGTNFGSMEQLLQHSAQQQMEMLTIQERVQSQTQEFTTISNILKARHDAEMAAINNMRS